MPAKGSHFHHTEEAKRKIVKALIGRPVSVETRRKISEKNKGRHFSPATEFKEGHNVSAELRRKVSEAQRSRKHSEETKRKMSNAHKLNPFWKGKKFSKQHCQNLSESHKGIKPSQATRKKKAKIMRDVWADPAVREKRVKAVMRAVHVRPTKPEQRLIDIINKHELPFKYVGDGKVVLGGRCPDFINCNGGKQVIEVFGDYWHSPLLRRNMRASQGYEATIKAYAEYGFKTLILWENEMSNESLVLRRINEFMGVV